MKIKLLVLIIVSLLLVSGCSQIRDLNVKVVSIEEDQKEVPEFSDMHYTQYAPVYKVHVKYQNWEDSFEVDRNDLYYIGQKIKVPVCEDYERGILVNRFIDQ